MLCIVLSHVMIAARAWLASTGAIAQPPAHLVALSVPPASVGTCVATRPMATRDTSGSELRGRRLVMTVRNPGGRREMTVHTDAGGRVRVYAETAHWTTGPASSAGENVIASTTRDGSLTAWRMHSATVMEMPAAGRLDTAALRTMRERATTTRQREVLGAPDQARVRAVAAWLLGRCPA